MITGEDAQSKAEYVQEALDHFRERLPARIIDLGTCYSCVGVWGKPPVKMPQLWESTDENSPSTSLKKK